MEFDFYTFTLRTYILLFISRLQEFIIGIGCNLCTASKQEGFAIDMFKIKNPNKNIYNFELNYM